jgi:hypothetical protein
MFSILDKIGGIFSKAFVISTMLPVFAVFLINVSLLYISNARFRGWMQTQKPNTAWDSVSTVGCAILLLVTVGFVLSAVTPYLREIMQGQHFPVGLTGLLTRKHALHAASLHTELNKLREDRRKFGEDSATWMGDVQSIAANGIQTSRPWREFDYWYANLQSLRERRLRACVLEYKDLSAMLVGLKSRAQTGDFPVSTKEVVREFADLVEYAIRRCETRAVELFTEIHRSYGSTPAPTRLGNQANALAAYSEIRYGFSLELAWARFQKVLLDSPSSKYNDLLSDVKSRLDAAVLLFWLILATSVIWSAALTTFSISLPLFLLASIGGWIACYSLYNVTASAHAAFAEVVRSIVDMYRFDLLKALNIQRPEGPIAEKVLWEKVRRRLEFGEEADIRYTPAPSTGIISSVPSPF